ncbi:LysR family transcriptional regulator [Vibrio sp. CAU 1672]|uniref:LysR family transcriptional regulator n=1 Tax=Vibrio sp. CAU 1672 TaxID=3032594 RepID=UPI0023DB8D19|nr:LysR family transcriptional regulator [Vibrio sp. CAU 1672]MDF2154558.1 LysR substrate-binding domain-containing protein [Vibrio sp. CAU 1672]
MDRLTSIEIFVAAVECGSFAAVTDERDISAQMVGKHIRKLEESLGTKLLNKSTRHQSLTPAGEQYYRRCKSILAELQAAEDEVMRSVKDPHGTLKIAAPFNFGSTFLAPLLARFQQAYPKITLDVRLGNQFFDIQKGGYDLLFITHTTGHENMVAKKIRSYSIMLCAAPKYLKEHGYPQHPDELTHHQCLQFNTNKYLLEWKFHDGKKRITPKINSRLSINSSQALLNAALEGAGFTIQPSYEVQELIKQGRLVQVLANFPLEKIDLYAIYPPHMRDTVRLSALLKFIMANT